jgi:hypothetical protein
MWFLLNNPLVMFVFLVMTGLVVYTIILFKNELSINNILKNKQYSMRLEVSKKVRFSRKMKILSTSTITPIIVIVLILSISVGGANKDLGNLEVFNEASDIEKVYSNFSSKMETYLVPTFGKKMDQMESDSLSEYDSILGDNYMYSDSYEEMKVISQSGFFESKSIQTSVTDNDYIYSIEESTVVITKAYSNELEADALQAYKRLPQGDFLVNGMYVDEDYLIVIKSKCDSVETFSTCSNVSVLTYEKATDFEVMDEYTLSGTFEGIKKFGKNLVVITNKIIPFENIGFELDNYLPSFTSGNTEQATYQDIIYSEGTYPNSFTTIFGIDLQSSAVDMEVILSDSAYNVYVSDKSVYLVGNVYVFEPFSTFVDLEHPISETKTAIMEIEMDEHKVDYSEIGFVDGYALNNFAMDEYKDELRIVTTSVSSSYQNDAIASLWSQKVINRLWVLDDELNIISVLDEQDTNQTVAGGEIPQSVFFIGEYCYISTFEKNDSLYVIDLSDSMAPSSIGTLNTSSDNVYIKPINNNYLLSVRFNNVDDSNRAVVISTFDITDKLNPLFMDQFTLNDGVYDIDWSGATYDFNAIKILGDDGMIILPYSLDTTGEVTPVTTSGLVIFGIDSSYKLTNAYNVSHETVEEVNNIIYESFIIEDYLYTLSNKYIKVSLIENPGEFIKSLELNNE